LHLTSGPAGADAVRAALRLLGRDEQVIGLGDALAVGPLSDIDHGAASRLDWWTRVSGRPPDGAEGGVFDDSAVWQTVTDDDRDVVCWHGPHAHEWLCALRACAKLRSQATRVHEVRLVAPAPGANGRALPAFYGAVPIVGPAALADAWAACGPITDVEARAGRWAAIRARSGDWFRELEGDEVVHLGVDAYDERIVDACKRKWTDSILVVGRVAAVTPTGDAVLGWRCRELMGPGVLEGRGATNRLGLPDEVRRA
jgi:hypothetical protein